MIAFIEGKPASSITNQHGAATIAMAIILLILISVAVFTVNGSIIRETKVINSGARAQLAFEAAEAGLANAIDYLSNNPERDASGNVDLKLYHNMDGDSDDTRFKMDVGNGSAYVTLSGTGPRIIIESTGYSDDSTARRTISQIAGKPDPLPNLPANPLTAISDVLMVGSSTIVNPEGNFNIWTGGDVDLSQNNQGATLIADPQGSDYPGCLQRSGLDDPPCSATRSSDKDSEGQDLVQNDSSLANSNDEELFQFYFGLPSDIYKQYVVTLERTADNINNKDSHLDYAEEIIWVDVDDGAVAELENKTKFGCGSSGTGGEACAAGDIKPSVLIIDGDAVFDGVEIFGLVFVTGNVEIRSSTDIRGALIAAGQIRPDAASNAAKASMDLVFDSAVLRLARGNGNLLPVAGSWKDFTR